MSPALVSATINALVAGAPDALDTLNELAAALGDDPNFSATILAELNKLKTPVVTAIVDDAALDAVNATSIWTAAQGVLNPPLAIGGTIEHTELSDGSAIQKAYRITPDGVFLTKHICTRRTGTWSGWTADGPDIGDLVIQTHGGDLLDRLEANGAVMNRTSYADLFWRTGTTYGAGDGATTFGTLDARGEFLRGWDNGRGVDAGRSLGSYQPGTKTVGERGDTVSTNAHTVHDVGNIHADPVYETNFDTCIQYDGETSNIYLSSSSVWWMTVRPRNIAQMFCIKF
jgi:phage-related tail fiber protein